MKRWLSEELETVVCDFCGCDEYSLKYLRKDGMNVVECKTCGLAFLNPRPKSALIPRFYDKEYFNGDMADQGLGGLRCNKTMDEEEEYHGNTYHQRVLQLIEDNFQSIHGKSVLEIGCATGDFLHKLKKRGAIVKGLEISEFAAKEASRRGLEIDIGVVEDMTGVKEFDLILALEVIEHVLSPSSFMDRVSKFLKEGGKLILSTPNYGCSRRWGGDWMGFQTSFEHLYYFDLKSLKFYCPKNNLEIFYWETTNFPGKSQSCFRFWHKQKERVNVLKYFIREVGMVNTFRSFSSKKKGYYRFGAGHTLIAIFTNVPSHVE